jgi:hypothetical protein
MMALMLNFKVLGFWIKEVLQLYNLIWQNFTLFLREYIKKIVYSINICDFKHLQERTISAVAILH